MKIDIFNHLFPKRFYSDYISRGDSFKDMGRRVQNIPTIFDLDRRFRALDEFGEYVQLLTLPGPPIEELAGPEESPMLAKIANDDFAELVRKHPDRFIGFGAGLPMNNPDAALKEMDRAVTQLGAKGVQIYTNVLGKPLDLPEFQPLFEYAAKSGTVVWLHPVRGAEFADYRTEDKSLYEIWWTFGWPYETSVAMSRLIFAGIFDRFPDLKIITHHLGGMIPYFTGRTGHGWDQMGTRTSDTDYKSFRRAMKKSPIEYFKHFYADTALFGARAGTRCGLDFFGADHVLYASDMPFETTPGLYARETIQVIESLGLTAEDKEKIFRKNAERLLNIA
jgi:aminocarboxymuconate-semialdehyde decarboxylase